ncbi:hypothetical protein QVG61_11580 [Thiohalobacter sp. IOR34]|uniref:hypothetical protein n=1 Tax=Thiohalobacter sp. IOR34 TaxID=3057176 RepID=UPI0025B1D11A|nr:hypothetical protein [Thiohalobacter sp. IOR34]WJW75123.1 hypothetical protein QVG61_11580 [Thiohalobacter sp. IOR34]
MSASETPKPSALAPSLGLERAEPLFRRAPRCDENGRPLTDFMMVIPKLRNKPPRLIQDTIAKIERILACYAKEVVFADLNLQINVLWVITHARPGICLEIPVAINDAVPEALLVAQPRPY